MRRYSRLKKIISVLLILLIILIGIAVYYVSEYYHALNFDKFRFKAICNVNVESFDGFTVYGNPEAEVGFIFYPGGKVEEKAYEPLLMEIASQGICCALVDMPFRLAVFRVNGAKMVQKQITGVEQWYLGGHSLGGAMASWYVAEHTDDFAGLILLAAYPTKELSENFPVLSIYGSEDQVLNQEKYNEKTSKISDLTEYVIEGGNHAYFGNYGEQSGDGESTISKEEQWEITTEKVVDFINDKEGR